jgi:transposase InsO family protein
MEAASSTAARCALVAIPLAMLGVIWAAIHSCWWWTVGCILGLLLDQESLSPEVRSLGCYLILPWLIVVLNRLALSLSNFKAIRSFIAHWFDGDTLPECVQMAPVPVPFSCIRISLNKTVLFCLLLAKFVVWNGLWSCIVCRCLSLPSQAMHFVRYLNEQDYNQLLIEAMDLLQSQEGDLELSWVSFRSWKQTLSEPFDSKIDDNPFSVDTSAPSKTSLEDYFSYPDVKSAIEQHDYKLGWRVRRMCRSVGKLVDKRLARVENEAKILSSLWAESKALDDDSGSSSVEDYSALTVRFLSSFNPAVNGCNMLGSERLSKDRLRVITDPHKVSVDLQGCYGDVVSHALRFVLPAMTETVLNSIGGPSGIPLIMDTGASCCVSPCRDDFVELNSSETKITDLSSTNSVAGEGLIEWKVLDTMGRCQTIRMKGYYVPKASVRLLSPQCLLQLDETEKSYITQTTKFFRVHLADGTTLDASYGRANLPILPMYKVKDSNIWAQTFSFTSQDRKAWIRHLHDEGNQNLSLAQKELLLWHQRLSHAGLHTIHNLCRQRRKPKVTSVEGLALLRDKPLPCTYKMPADACDNMLCGTCAAAKAHRKTPGVSPPNSTTQFDSIDPTPGLKPGDCVSCDHYCSPVKGRVMSDSGYSSTRYGYEGGCIFVDHASSYMFHRGQKSLAASDTIRSKLAFEREAADSGVKIKQIHTDNGVFNSAEFRLHCEHLKQKLSFSAVGAHHQNGVAENAIRTICNMARANMMHAMIRWPERNMLDLWPFAMSYAIWVHNRLPPGGYGKCPLEIWTKQKFDKSELTRAHAFGCPVYVLDPALQDGKKTPKWDSRARQGIFVGFSEEHSSLAPLVFNPKTQHVSPQYHVIFDDKFTTVPSLYSVDQRNETWSELFKQEKSEVFIDAQELTSTRSLLQDQWLTDDEVRHRQATGQIPLVNNDADEIVDLPAPSARAPQELLQYERRLVAQLDQEDADGVKADLPAPSPDQKGATSPPADSEGVTPPPNPNAVPEGATQSLDSSPSDAPEGARLSPSSPDDCSVQVPSDAATADANDLDDDASDDDARYPRRSNKGDWKDGPARNKGLKEHAGKWKTGLTCFLALPMFAMSAVREWGHPPPAVTNVGAREGPIYSTLKVSKEHLSHLAVQQEDWSTFGEKTHLGIIGSYSAYLEPDVSDDFDSYTLADVQPHILQAKMSVSDPDNPTYRQAMASPDADKWWDAMVIEMKTLEEDMKCWQLVKQPDSPGINILPSKWAFKLKRYPDGTAKKFKARFCVRGDRQVEGVDFWETWAPVVQWSTVRTMMILSTKLGLKSAQADITAAFVHADLEEGEDIYVQQPKGMERGTGLVLKLKKSVYGLKQAPRYFFTHLSRKMELCGLKQSNKDPCLFIGKTVIAVVYVDDVLFYSKSDDEIDRIITSLRNDHNILIRREGDAEGFLGVSIVKEKSSLVLTQSGLTERIVKALGLCSSYSTAVRTPAELSPLPKDADGEPAVGNFNYAAVVGMLLYLSGHSRPDIAFAVHQCARYTFRPTKRHEQALVRIGRYLKGTMNRGLIMSPTNSPSIDCYPDADFAGLYGHEDSQDPHCARSRTGYIIMAFGCPVLWKSRLQTEIALSTMEAEYVALSTACKDLFPIVDMVKELAGSVGIEIKSVANMHINIHEDNVGALTLAKLEPARMTPRSKHYAIKYHWFREHVHANRVNILKIDSKNQLGDLFTKGLARPAFEHLRCLLMGW